MSESPGSSAGPFPDPAFFPFVPYLEAATPAILEELARLDPERDFGESPDSLSTPRDGYDERGWRSFPLFGEEGDVEANRGRCPATTRAAEAVPGMVHAGFSLFRPGTHLFPHRGEREGVLRAHLGLVIPPGDVGLRAGGEFRRWIPGHAWILDDTFEHEAWNHADSDRVVLIVSFAERR